MFASDVPASTADLAAMRGVLARLDPDVADAERIDQLRLLTEIESAVAAVKAQVTARFAASQRAAQAAAGERADRVGRGVAAQVALALRISPYHAQRYVGWATILTTELPHTFAALRDGRISEWRAVIVARETIWLSRDHRGVVDAELAPQLGALGNRRVAAAAKRIGYRLDPGGFLARTAAADNDRRVSIRPAPDCMTRLTALLPLTQGVAAYAALCRTADLTTAVGDERGRGQIMADTLVERVTGQTTAADVPIEIHLVMTEHTLLSGDPEPAHLDGYGPIPADLARQYALDGDAPRWIRRLFTAPGHGQLAAMETRRRTFTPAQRRFLRLRDQTCRTPYCNAAIRHADHITPAAHGGATAIDNGQGYCQACNHAKQAPGWQMHPITSRDGPHQVHITTPTGHTYHSRAPDPPGRAA